MITETINGITLTFETGDTLFSPRRVDAGTLAMLAATDFRARDKVLDLGCGYGVVGIYAAKLLGADAVVMSDIDETAVAAAKRNAVLNGVGDIRVFRSDGFRELRETDFSVILSNPPYHTDFSVAKHFIEKGFNRLRIGGRLYLVTKRRDWYQNKLTAIFGGTRVLETDGYFVFCAEKRSAQYHKTKR